ncbi:MAG: hypothetical protein PHY48_02635 [Candidatus Cloacimonetes bacterium]|nr:hypothetical protein [Candidatus Cloacimonadota bacterium]
MIDFVVTLPIFDKKGSDMINESNNFIFSYDSYRLLLRQMKQIADFQLFKDWSGDKVFLLRHDVDFDIALAHKLATIEYEEKVLTTYFVMTSCPSYNILSKSNRIMLREMCSMGHEIGLHFDPTLYDDDLNETFNHEIDALSFAIGNEISSVSLHNPSIHGTYPFFEGYVNAYKSDLFSDANYISDSRFSFRGKNIYDFINRVHDTMIQIVFHPMHFSDHGYGYDSVMPESVIRYAEEIHRTFSVNSTYEEQVGDDFFNLLKKKLQDKENHK